MGAAVDPTFPLFPVASILATICLGLVLASSLIRQSWNLGVTFLCFWLLLENLSHAINAIIWSDDADIKLHGYCDIVSRLQVFCSVLKPMSTLIITRRLYLIAHYLPMEVFCERKERWGRLVDWTLGLGIPAIVSGPLYYVVQNTRFVVIEGFGCTGGTTNSILTLLLIQVWFMIPPLLSAAFYYPSTIRIFYGQSRAFDRLLNSHDRWLPTRTNYLRVLALASIDIFLTLPLSITRFVLAVLSTTKMRPAPFYPGWDVVHHDWTPVTISWAMLNDKGAPELAFVHYGFWISPIFAFAFFGLFGLTEGARTSYWRVFRVAAAVLGRRRAHLERGSQSIVSPIRFDVPVQEISLSVPGMVTTSSLVEIVPIPPGLASDSQVKPAVERTDESCIVPVHAIAEDERGSGTCLSNRCKITRKKPRLYGAYRRALHAKSLPTLGAAWTNDLPNSVVQLQLAVNTDFCVKASSTAVGFQLTLDSCDPSTTFDLPQGAPSDVSTQLALNATFSNGGPIACISASGVDLDGPVFLHVCQDDKAQHWNVEGGAGRGSIVNAGSITGTNCLTATSTEQGSTVIYSTCLGSATQEWTPTHAINFPR
ncbi:unnamed protein product [Peniophora sp. CBMAI 1063]|nr:unnamed protein product [Peniophora sp. CBMAI 1063]